MRSLVGRDGHCPGGHHRSKSLQTLNVGVPKTPVTVTGNSRVPTNLWSLFRNQKNT